MQEKIKELLGLNLPNNVVASAVGCGESYISQLMSDENFAQEVSELRVANTMAHAARDKKYDSIEDELLVRLEEKLESGLAFTNPKEILAAIRIINAAKRRAAPSELAGVGTPKQVVNLVLPESTAFAARFLVNGQNQVVEVAGKPMATMSAKGVNAKLEELRKNGENKDHSFQRADEIAATERLNGLVKLEHLPVDQLL